MTAEQAVAYGMVDHIIEKRPPIALPNHGFAPASGVSAKGNEPSLP